MRNRERIPRVFIHPSNQCGIVQIRVEDVHHLLKVLRLKPGDRVEGVTGNGDVFLCEISDLNRRAGTVAVLRKLDAGGPPRPSVTVGLAWIRRTPMEWAVEKLTELGCDGVCFLSTDFTAREARGDGALASRLERCVRIMEESVKQCRRSRPMSFLAPSTAEAFFQSDASALKLLASADSIGTVSTMDACSPLSHMPESVCVAVGPEGGWSDREVGCALASGFQPVSLGNHVLRAETAAAAAVAILMQAWPAAPAPPDRPSF